MTPREVDEMTDSEYRAFWKYAEDDVREQNRAARKAARR